jgi:hypothetical protein
MSWNDLFKSSLPLSVRSQIGRLCEYFVRIERNMEATAVPVFNVSGTICTNLEKTSITHNRYLYLSLYLLRDWMSKRPHSQTSTTFVTSYGFLGKFYVLADVMCSCLFSRAMPGYLQGLFHVGKLLRACVLSRMKTAC